MIARILVFVFLVLVAAYAGATFYYWPGDRIGEIALDQPDPTIDYSYANGLDDDLRAEFHHLSQGAELFPLKLLQVIDNPEDEEQPFINGLSRYGLLPDPQDPGGLPVGISIANNRNTLGLDMIGITCAACHVGEIRHGGKGVRVDGAPNMFDMQTFYADVIRMTKKAFHEREANDRVKERLFARSYEQYGVLAPALRPFDLILKAVGVGKSLEEIAARRGLATVIEAAIGYRDAKLAEKGESCATLPHACTSGFGRLDAFNGTRNFVLAQLDLVNIVDLDAPVKFPPVWGFEDFDWVEWSQNTNSVMERNVTETIGAGALVKLEPGEHMFESSVPARNMHRLEQLAYYIRPPAWPEDVLGPIDAELRDRGAPIYAERCASCHEYGDADRTETGLLRLRRFSPEELGVDPAAALKVACPVKSVGPIDIPKRRYSQSEAEILAECAATPDPPAPFEAYAFADVVRTAVAAVKNKAYAREGVTDDERIEFEDLDRRGEIRWRDTMLATGRPFAARPLAGVWAAAPYLHNGAVPTLADLLTPPAERINRFSLGQRDYDPERVGYRTDLPEADWRFIVETETAPGAGNGGHDYGTDLSAEDKRALLEYLKSL